MTHSSQVSGLSSELTPPPALVLSLRNSAPQGIRDAGATRELWLINQAYATGANQKLEACIEWVSTQLNCTDQEHLVPYLRETLRPKPISLKEQALKLLPEIKGEEVRHLCPLEVATIRRALEALPND
jgi:hypothetical protein